MTWGRRSAPRRQARAPRALSHRLYAGDHVIEAGAGLPNRGEARLAGPRGDARMGRDRRRIAPASGTRIRFEMTDRFGAAEEPDVGARLGRRRVDDAVRRGVERR